MRGLFKILWGVVAVFGAIVSRAYDITDTLNVWNLGLSEGRWITIGLTIFFVAVLALVYGQHRDNQLLRREIQDVASKRAGDIDVAKSRDVVHYHNRRELPSDFGEFDDIKNAWVLWFTGVGARERLIHQSGNIKRIILLDPAIVSSPQVLDYLKNQAKNREPKTIAQVIRDISKEAWQAKVKVKWLNAVPECLFVIHDPQSQNAWIRVEILDLDRFATEWESYKVYKTTNQWLFTKLLVMYQKLWSNSKEVTEHDFE